MPIITYSRETPFFSLSPNPSKISNLDVRRDNSSRDSSSSAGRILIAQSSGPRDPGVRTWAVAVGIPRLRSALGTNIIKRTASRDCLPGWLCESCRAERRGTTVGNRPSAGTHRCCLLRSVSLPVCKIL